MNAINQSMADPLRGLNKELEGNFKAAISLANGIATQNADLSRRVEV